MSFFRSFFLMLLSVTLVCAAHSAALAKTEGWDEKEAVAAKDLYITGLKLVDPALLSAAAAESLSKSGALIAYVPQTATPGKYECTGLDEHHVKQAAEDIAVSLAKLDGAAANIGLKYVLICGEAKANGMSIGGIPVPPLKTLMLSVGGSGAVYRQHIFFHELYHYMEFVIRRGLDDAAWNAKFSGYGGKDVTWHLGSGAKGFVSAYAQMSPEEDRAEIFAHLMGAPDRLREHVNIKNNGGTRHYSGDPDDAVLREKISYVQAIAVDEFGLAYANKF